MKTVKIPDEVHRKLVLFKYQIGARSIGEALDKLLSGHASTRGAEEKKAEPLWPKEILDVLPEGVSTLSDIIGELNKLLSLDPSIAAKAKEYLLSLGEERLWKAELVMVFFTEVLRGTSPQEALEIAKMSADQFVQEMRAQRTKEVPRAEKKEEGREEKKEPETVDEEALELADKLEEVSDELEGDVKEKVLKARDLVLQGKYKEALKVLEELRREPLPAEVLDTLRNVRTGLVLKAASE